MMLFLLVIAGIVWIKTVWLASLTLSPSRLSEFELRRRAAHSARSHEELLRNDALRDVQALRQIIVVILIVAMSALLIGAIGWLWGVAVSCIAGIIAVGVSSRALAKRWADRLYVPLEGRVLTASKKIHPALRPFVPSSEPQQLERVDSREHLVHLVEASDETFSDEQRALIVHAMRFSDMQVSSVMTHRKDIKTVKKKEFLGPLVLDEIHGYGHSHLPVIGADVDHVVGVLDVRGLLSLDITRSMTAEKAMDKKVISLEPGNSLEAALSLFLESHQHICIVVNHKNETVGLVTLGDVVAALIGRRITKRD